MDPVDVVALTRTLVDINSTTGHEAEIGGWLAAWLRRRGYTVVEQPVSGERCNLFATIAQPTVVLSTHLDCVPPFFASREEKGVLFGRGTCDAKGILAAQIAAADRLRVAGEEHVGLLFVVGEERGSDGARAANSLEPDCRYIVNGEPTDNRLGAATRGMLRVRLKAAGRAAHSAYPELGESAIEKLVTALATLRTIALPEDEWLGKTHYSVGLVSGGVAPNVIPPYAYAELLFRTVGPGALVLEALAPIRDLVRVEEVLEVPPARLMAVTGFDAVVFPYTTDIPLLTRWGAPLLFGPGSVLVAHTDQEHVKVSDLRTAVDCYVRLATCLLEGRTSAGEETRP